MTITYKHLKPEAKEFFEKTGLKKTDKNAFALAVFATKYMHSFWREVVKYVDEEFITPSWDIIREEEQKAQEVKK